MCGTRTSEASPSPGTQPGRWPHWTRGRQLSCRKPPSPGREAVQDPRNHPARRNTVRGRRQASRAAAASLWHMGSQADPEPAPSACLPCPENPGAPGLGCGRRPAAIVPKPKRPKRPAGSWPHTLRGWPEPRAARRAGGGSPGDPDLREASFGPRLHKQGLQGLQLPGKVAGLWEEAERECPSRLLKDTRPSPVRPLAVWGSLPPPEDTGRRDSPARTPSFSP